LIKRLRMVGEQKLDVGDIGRSRCDEAVENLTKF
jgi:hypothetical protein